MVAKSNQKELMRVGLQALSVLQQRGGIASALGKSFGGDRDLYKELGYPTEITFEKYAGMHARQDLAKRIVDLPAQDTWRDPPTVRDEVETAEDDEESQTPFEQAWEALVKRLHVFHYMERVDRLAGIGRYGVLLIGMKGEADLKDEALENSLNSPEDVIFLASYDEGTASVERLEQDPKSPRYGTVAEYKVKVGADLKGTSLGTQLVNWSRVIHVAEDLLENEVYGSPRLEAVFNRLQDLDKVVGGGAEAFWRLIYKGLVLTTTEGYDLPEDKVTLDKIEEFVHGFRRILELEGMEAKFEGGEVVDPKGMMESIIALIAGSTGIPQRILIGAERGELASTTDQATWAGSVASRRQNFAEPMILRPFIDRLIRLGALPTPSNADGYTVEWEPIFELSEKDQTVVAAQAAAAIASIAPPGAVDLILDPAKFIEVYLPRLIGATRDIAAEEAAVEEEVIESEETPASIEFLTELKQRAMAQGA